jgi:hypothetical protein
MFASLRNLKQREFLTHYSKCAQITVAAKRAFARSDRILIFLLEHLKPNVYGKQVNGNRTHSGEIPQRPEVDLTALSDDELDTLERILAKAGVEHNAGSDSKRAEAPVTEPCLSAVADKGKVLMESALKTDSCQGRSESFPLRRSKR